MQCWTFVPLIDAAIDTVYKQELVGSHFFCKISWSCLIFQKRLTIVVIVTVIVLYLLLKSLKYYHWFYLYILVFMI